MAKKNKKHIPKKILSKSTSDTQNKDYLDVVPINNVDVNQDSISELDMPDVSEDGFQSADDPSLDDQITTSNSKKSKKNGFNPAVVSKYKNTSTPNSITNTIDNKPARLFALIFGTLGLLSAVLFGAYFIPNVVLSYTDEAKNARDTAASASKSKQKEEVRQKNIEEENKSLTFTNRSVNMGIKDFGTLKINLADSAAPKTTENFVRLVHRGFYNNLSFHRIVKEPNFSVIQGGDPTGTGQGGESATGGTLPDELWSTKPEFAPSQQINPQTNQPAQGPITNTPAFRDPSLYKNFDKTSGTVTYPKGEILMAKTSAPDSATSQFFITLADTQLPAQYTAFGRIDSNNLDVLDKILNTVNPVVNSDPAQQGTAGTSGEDGKPDKELKIEKAELS